MKHLFGMKNIKKSKFALIYLAKLLTILIFSSIVGMGYVERNNLRDLGVFNVISNSMSPAVKKGSILITEASGVYETGDVITFLDPRNNLVKITHRISSVELVNGELVYITKGDANSEVDPWYVENEFVVGKVIFTIPLIGFVVSMIKSPIGLLFLIMLPLGAMFFMELEMLINNINRVFKKNGKKKINLPYGV